MSDSSIQQIPPIKRVEFLQMEVERYEREYKELCEDCTTLAGMLEERRERARNTHAVLMNLSKEFLATLREVRSQEDGEPC